MKTLKSCYIVVIYVIVFLCIKYAENDTAAKEICILRVSKVKETFCCNSAAQYEKE